MTRPSLFLIIFRVNIQVPFGFIINILYVAPLAVSSTVSSSSPLYRTWAGALDFTRSFSLLFSISTSPCVMFSNLSSRKRSSGLHTRCGHLGGTTLNFTGTAWSTSICWLQLESRRSRTDRSMNSPTRYSKIAEFQLSNPQLVLS